MTIQLSAFADEISADLHEQLAVLQREGIQHLELRSAWDTNVLDLSDSQVEQIVRALAATGIRVSSIGSPIGKVPIDSSFDEQVHRFERAITLARTFQAPYIRIFSFYAPESDPTAVPADYREEVVWRLRELTARAAAANITLLLENEKEVYGDTIDRCRDLLESIDHPRFRAIIDPANFVQCDQIPYPDAYEALQPWLAYMHVKDALPDGTVVAAGEGAGRWPDLLARLQADGYHGFFSIEPHLAAAERFQGFSGPDLFGRAAQAFQRLLGELDRAYA